MANQSSYRSKTYHLVIEEFDKENSRHITELDIDKYIRNEMRISFYAFIKHNEDVDEEGNKKRIHYHVVIVLNQSYSKNTIIHCFASGLTCNVDIISCRSIKTFVGSIQYLLHKNNKDKFQYEYLDIWTNDLNEVNACLYANTSTYELDIEYLYQLVKKSNSIAEIYQILGLEKSKKYRSLIIDMYKEEHIERFL